MPTHTVMVARTRYNLPQSTTDETTEDGHWAIVTAIVIEPAAFATCCTLRAVDITARCRRIGPGAFRGCVNLETVSLGTGMHTVGSLAFAGCAKLTTITLPATVRTVDDGAFRWCTALTRVVLPDGVRVIRARAFQGCSALESIHLPYGLERLGQNVFRECSQLKGVVVPSTVTYVGASAFAQCWELKSIQYSNALPIIHPTTFKGCRSLTSVTVGVDTAEESPARTRELPTASLRAICEGAFSGCTNLRQVELPRTLAVIEREAFEYCSNLNTHLALPCVEWIGMGAFYHCHSLPSVTFGPRLRSIGHGVFKQTGLTSVNLPPSLTYLGLTAFSGCKFLVSVSIHSDTTLKPDFPGRKWFPKCYSLRCVATTHDAPITVADFREGDTDGYRYSGRIGDGQACHRQAVTLRWWSRHTHVLCSPIRRVWVHCVLCVGHRLSGRGLHLPAEMWVAILEWVPRHELGTHAWQTEPFC